MSLKKVVEQIKKNKNFLITSHINLEGDAIGSQLAMRQLLLNLGKRAIIVNEDRIPEEYNFLPGIKYIKRPKDIKDFRFDVLLALDCSDVGRFKEVYALFSKDKLVINIDHHISNNNFGAINWVDQKASSTVEMIYRLYKKMGIGLDKNKALCLYVGLVTDTGSFRYPNTNAFSHKIAFELMQYNLLANKVYKNIYENLKFEDLKLLSKILLNPQQDTMGEIVWFEIKRKILKAKRPHFDLTEYVLSFGRLIKDAEVLVLFKEDLFLNNQVRVNLRSSGKVDVNKIAQIFGGGGHRTASGCTLKGKLKDVEYTVLKRIKDFIK